MIIETVERVLALCERLFLVLANAFFAVMVINTMANVASRALFNRALPWAWPWTEFLFVWVVMIGLFVVYRRRTYISIDFFARALGHRAMFATRLIADTAILVFVGILVFHAPRLLTTHVGVIDIVGLQRSWLIAPMYVSAFLIFINTLLDVAKAVRGDPEPHGITPDI